MAFIALVAVAGCASSAPAPLPRANAVVAYLDGAERQAESADQEREIERALQDLKSLPADVLATRRYADYTLAPGRWSLADLIARYFVPRAPQRLDPVAFYRDARDPRAIAVIDAHLAALREQRQVGRTR